MEGATLVIVPVLRRPHRVAPLLESLRAGTPEPHRVVFVGSVGDQAEHDAVRAEGADLLILQREAGPGDYARKINHAFALSDEPLVFTGADDLHFHPGWLTAAKAKLEPGIGVVGTNDLGNPRVLRGVHSTHSLVTRVYVDTFGTIDEPGKVLHEGYWHEYCDDEMVETSWYREAWAFAKDSVVEHLHPAWRKAAHDDVYGNDRPRLKIGRRLFLERRPMWCPNNGPRVEP